MSYNVLNLPDGSIEGHKTLGKNGSSPYCQVRKDIYTNGSYTLTQDGFCIIEFDCMKSSTTWSGFHIFINGVAIYNYRTWKNYNENACISFPASKGAVISATNDTAGGGNIGYIILNVWNYN